MSEQSTSQDHHMPPWNIFLFFYYYIQVKLYLIKKEEGPPRTLVGYVY